MVKEEDLLRMLQEWLERLREAIAVDSGESMCEASRMVLSISSILRAYYPDRLTEEVREQSRTLFNKAVVCITSDLRNGEDKDGCYGLYKRNIGRRLETLEELEKEPCVEQGGGRK